MKLQFAFGNPRKGKKKKKSTKVKKSKKSVAKLSKRPKTKHMKSKKAKKSSKLKARSTFKGKARKHSTKKKNPTKIMIHKGGKLVHSMQRPNIKDVEASMKQYQNLKAAYEKAPIGSEKKKSLRESLAKLSKTVKSKLQKTNESAEKVLQRFQEEGAKISRTEIGMAKKKKTKTKTKSKSKSKVKSKAKKAKTKKAHKKSHKKAHKKSHKKVHKSAHKKAHKKTHKKSSHKRKKRRAKMITHKHSAKTGHFKHGSVVKFKKTVGKGRKKVKVSGIFKLNPFRSNPMSKIKDLAKSATKLDQMELISLGVGGALVPIINSGISKIPYMDVVVSKINDYAGPQATGSIVPMLVGALMNVASEQFVKDAATKKYINAAGDGLISAGIIGLTMSLSQKYVVEGMMAGVLYSPMNGVNYTPMNGVNYTPMNGVPQLAGPDFGRSSDYGGSGGYTQDKRFSSADFGHASDEDIDEDTTEDDMMSDNLSGGLG